MSSFGIQITTYLVQVVVKGHKGVVFALVFNQERVNSWFGPRLGSYPENWHEGTVDSDNLNNIDLYKKMYFKSEMLIKFKQELQQVA